MAIKDSSQLKTDTDGAVFDNNQNLIEALDHNNLLKDFIDSFLNKVDDVGLIGLAEFDSSRDYVQGQAVLQNGSVYKANKDVNSGTGFQAADWDLIASDWVKSLTAGDSPFSVTAHHRHLFCDCTNGGIEVDLPAPADIPNKRIVIFKTDSSSNNVTLDPNGNNLDGATTNRTITGQYRYIELVSDGSNYFSVQLKDLPRNLEDLTRSVIEQIKKIKSVTVSNTQWGYVGAMDQGVATGDGVDFISLGLTAGVTVDSILDEDTMGSDSATALATQQSIKSYVDSQISSNDQLSEILSNGNTTGGTDIVVSVGDTILAPDGSASDPPYSFSNDTDTGIFRPGANIFGIAVNGAEGLRVNTTGISLDNGTTTIGSTEFNLLDGMTAKTGVDQSFVTGTAGADGKIPSWNSDGDLTGNGDLEFDDTNGRLGIGGVSSISATVHIEAEGDTSGETALQIDNTSSTLWKVDGNGDWYFERDDSGDGGVSANWKVFAFYGSNGGSFQIGNHKTSLDPGTNKSVYSIGNDNLNNISGAGKIVAVGNKVMGSLTDGQENVGVGNKTLQSITTEERNTAIGYEAGKNPTGGSNVFIGARAGTRVSGTISSTIAIGVNTLDGITGGSVIGIGGGAGWSWNNGDQDVTNSIYLNGGYAHGPREIVIGGHRSNSNTSIYDNIWLNGRFGNLREIQIQPSSVLDQAFSTDADSNSLYGSSVTDGSAANSILTLAGASGTGSGAGGEIQIKTAPAGSSGTSNNALELAARWHEQGYYVQKAIDSAIADGDLNNNEFSFYTDQTNNNLVVKVKYSGGTVKTGTISLS